ncbi:MAG TPA: hypothetical protein VJO32_13040 [Ktedonobacteraceae bacterium]|nr:hypothetical protein [Ktedonobacteraceae bacterium]
MSTTNIPDYHNYTANVSAATQRPQWLDEQLYPFQSHFVEVEGNRVHFPELQLQLFPGVYAQEHYQKTEAAIF